MFSNLAQNYKKKEKFQNYYVTLYRQTKDLDGHWQNS